jgi:DNA-binding winged helix-turn-helix (wHTH) protein
LNRLSTSKIGTQPATHLPAVCSNRGAQVGEKRVKTAGIREGSEPVCFDGFALDPARRQLTRDGQLLHLTPKAFDLLALLVDQAPRVVTKRELHERLWKDTFVSDTTLVGVVKELRRVLDDRSHDRPIIRTSHRIGYAFCRPVEALTRTPSGVVHWLLVEDRRITLHSGVNVIGRDPVAIVWLDSAAVSRRHARIVIDSSGVRLESRTRLPNGSSPKARIQRGRQTDRRSTIEAGAA